MKNLLKYKIWITLLLSPIFIAIGIFNNTGNPNSPFITFSSAHLPRTAHCPR